MVPPLFSTILLLLHHGDHRVCCVGVHLGAVRVGQAQDVATEFDHRALHAEADPEEGILFSRAYT
jgi:hypothetical protein